MLRIRIKGRHVSAHRREREKGFTLIELLVALTILSIMATVLYLTVGASATQTRQLSDRIEEQEQLRLALQKLTTDISNIYVDEESENLFFEGTKRNGPDGRSDQLRFTSLVFHWRNPGERVDELVTVSYSLTQTSGGEGGELVRVETPLTTPPPGSYGGEEAILAGVMELSVSYLDQQKQEKDSWSTRSAGQAEGLPAALRLKLRLKRGEGERTVSTLIPLPLGLRGKESIPEPGSGGGTNAP